jgi:hypothetical protein
VGSALLQFSQSPAPWPQEIWLDRDKHVVGRDVKCCVLHQVSNTKLDRSVTTTPFTKTDSIMFHWQCKPVGQRYTPRVSVVLFGRTYEMKRFVNETAPGELWGD